MSHAVTLTKMSAAITLVVFELICLTLASCGEGQLRNVLPQAQRAFEIGNFQEVVELLGNKCLDGDSEIESLALRGKSLFYLGAFREASADFERLQLLYSYSEKISFFMAQSYDSLQILDRADLEYKRLLSVDSTNISYLLKSASVKKRIGDFSSAKRLYNAVIQIDDSNHLAFNNLGVLFETEENYKQAIKCYTKAIGFNKVESFYLFNRAVSYLYLSDYKKALDDLNQAIVLEKGNGRFHLHRGIALYYLGDLANACLDWQVARKLNEMESLTYLEKYCSKTYL